MNERIERADDLLLKAINEFENDPRGSMALARSTALTNIVIALLLREMLYQSGYTAEPPNTNSGDGPPW